MRSRWYPAIAVWIGFLWGVGLCLAASADVKLPQVAQADTGSGDLPMIIAGPQNPTGTLEINDGIADLTALQFEIIAPQERDIAIDTVTIGFGLAFGEEVTTGNESFLDELRARLIIEDVNINGQQDAGEEPEGTQSVTDLEDPDTVPFTFEPPLLLEAGSSITFLVVVDINQPVTQSAAATSWRQPGPDPAIRNGFQAVALLFLPFAGLALYAAGCGSRRTCILALMVLGGIIMVAGCLGGDSENELRFVVNLPSNGITGEGERLGPSDAIAGVTIQLMR